MWFSLSTNGDDKAGGEAIEADVEALSKVTSLATLSIPLTVLSLPTVILFFKSTAKKKFGGKFQGMQG